MTVGGSGGAVETVMRVMTPGASVTLFGSSEAAGTTPIVPRMAVLGSGGEPWASSGRRVYAD